MAIDINDVTFLDEKDLEPLVDLEIRIDELKIQTVQKQAELRKAMVKLRRKLGLKMSDKIDVAQGIAVPFEKTLEPVPASASNGVPEQETA